jgi:hypothetical protein
VFPTVDESRDRLHRAGWSVAPPDPEGLVKFFVKDFANPPVEESMVHVRKRAIAGALKDET